MRKPRILIVDDELINRKLLHGAFRNRDYQILEATGGTEALELLSEDSSIDLILLDIMMPEMDGFEVCARIKNQPALREIPIIIITSLTDRDSKLRGLETGAIDFLTKPLDSVEVRLRVDQQLQLRQLYMELKQSQTRMRNEILAAKTIQMNLLPENDQNFSDSYSFKFDYYPCEELAGDFLDCIALNNQHIMFYITDVSGHGAASSLITIFVKEFIRSYAPKMEPDNPAGLIKLLNDTFLSMDFSQRFLTLLVCVLDLENNICTWSIAGANNPPMVLRENMSETLTEQSLPVGWFPDKKWANHSFRMEKNDLLLLYSDAATEVSGNSGVELGRENFKKMVEQNQVRENCDLQHLRKLLLDYSSNRKLRDDLTLIGLKRLI
ncbi:MAG: SpoIIE family protein phosphatase [Candidatus Cloacimonetes bacterium]|nr:SpoIIE family protein phosphatase [Candidatus Cloacimonadota bacterium]